MRTDSKGYSLAFISLFLGPAPPGRGLAALLQNIENPVRHLPHIHLALPIACIAGLYSFEPG
jgi:hypothetical protein